MVLTRARSALCLPRPSSVGAGVGPSAACPGSSARTDPPRGFGWPGSA